MKTKFLLLVLALCSLTAMAQQTKYALVIGAQNYTSLPPLRNSINDAKSMTNTLKAKGFQVETIYDPKSKREIKDAITRYYNMMTNKVGGIGLIFYAGHGMQYDGENYIIPVNTSLQSPADLEDECVRMNTFVSILQTTSKSLNILLLDACRSLPSFSRGSDQGLTKIDPPVGTIVVFATQAGRTASDGAGANGLFTSNLIKVINEPNITVSDVFKKVRTQVYAESREAQLPSLEDNSIGGDYFFSGVAGTTPAVVSVDPNFTPEQLYDKGLELETAGDYVEAAKWFQKSAEQGYADAQISLGLLYDNGRGVAQDLTQALDWYRRAADQGNGLGQSNVGIMYREGRGLPQNDLEAVRWFRKSADQGNAYGQDNLAWMYQVGKGVKQDDAEALYWYQKAADLGNLDALSKLGSMYRDGKGVPQNYTEAINWYKKAADQGDAEGQGNLAMMYRDGKGVPQNFAEALAYFRKAAAQGNLFAQSNLGWMYENGNGVPPYITEAIYWYQLAAAQGDEYSKAALARLKP